MEYTDKQKNAALELFKGCIISSLSNSFVPQNTEDSSDIDFDLEVEIFLDDYCVSVGDKQTTAKNIASMVEDEIANRLTHFNCEDSSAEDFIRTAIKSYLLAGPTMYRTDTLYASFADIFNYKVYEVEGIYFVMNFDEIEIDYEGLIEYGDGVDYDILDAAYKFVK